MKNISWSEFWPWWSAFSVDHVVLACLAVLIVFATLAWLTKWIIVSVVLRLARKTETEFDDQLANLLKKPIFVSVVFLGCRVIADIAQLTEGQHERVVHVLMTLLILVWTGFFLRFSQLFLQLLSRIQDRVPLVEPRTLPLFDNLAKLAIIGASIYWILVAWGVDPKGVLASAGIIGIAVGFAAKDSLANLFSGVFILADSPYKIGDYIVLDGRERGEVTQIGLRSTRLRTRDDVEITLPNAVIANAKIVNQSGGRWEKSRIRIPVGVAYGSDIEEVRSILMAMAESDGGLCKEPEPRVRLRAFGDSSLDFELMGWIDHPGVRGRTIDALLTGIYLRFQQEGIEIPYPKRDVYVKETPSITLDSQEEEDN